MKMDDFQIQNRKDEKYSHDFYIFFKKIEDMSDPFHKEILIGTLAGETRSHLLIWLRPLCLEQGSWAQSDLRFVFVNKVSL